MLIRTRFAVPFVALMVVVASVQAQPLVEHVPDDAIVYVGWRGTEAVGDAYQQSHLNALLTQTQLPRHVMEYIVRLSRLSPDGEQVGRLIDELAPILARRQWMVYFAGMNPPIDRHVDPTPRLGFLCDAGDDAQALRGLLLQLTQLIDDPDLPLAHWGAGENIVGLHVGEPREGGFAPPTLTNNERFRGAVQRMAADEAAVMLYFDFERFVQFTLEDDEGADDDEDSLRRLKLMGLDRVEYYIYTGRFVGQRWEDRTFLRAPSPRAGLLEFLDAPAITAEELALVPTSATWFRAFRLDVGRLIASIETMVAADDPENAPEEIAEGWGELNEEVGFDVRAELIEGLGSFWLVYSEASTVGPMGMGLCIVHPLKDAARVEGALRQLTGKINEEMGDGTFRFRRSMRDGMEQHTLTLPIGPAPTWAVHEGRLYIGMMPSTVSAAHAAIAKGDSLVNTPGFAAVRDRLGDQQALMVGYADLPRSVTGVYQTYLMGMMFAGPALTQQGLPNPNVLLPPLARITPHLSPAGRVSWVDDEGWHGRTDMPFPGSQLLSEDVLFGQSFLTLGTLLPAMGAARSTAREMQSNTQARGIHQAQYIYADGNNGRFTNDIAELYEGDYFTAEYAIAPHRKLPHEFKDWPLEQQSQWLRENASYILVPDLTSDVDSRKIAVFQRPEHSSTGAIGVVYNDNHVQIVHDIAEVDRQLQQQTGMTMQELIDRQVNYKAGE